VPALWRCATATFRQLQGNVSHVSHREYTNPAFSETHLFTVDAYALQHAEEHGPRSNAFHLMRLCWLIEHNGKATIRQVRSGGRAIHKAREETLRGFPLLETPPQRGELTVASVVRAKTSAEQNAKVRAWGQSVWDAWRVHHAWARAHVSEWYKIKQEPALNPLVSSSLNESRDNCPIKPLSEICRCWVGEIVIERRICAGVK
jgi:hypothetical protein